MHNIKDIRKDFALFAKSLEKRSLKIDFKNLQKLDEQNRQLIQEKEALEKEKKKISQNLKMNHCLKDLKKFPLI
jgi:seryl-tRNA synthetase